MSSVPRIQMSGSAGGPEVSRLAYGVWRLTEDPDGSAPTQVLAKIDACLEAGITTFDHADIYGGYACEALFGRAVQERPALKDDIEIITKCGIMLVDPARPGNRIKHYNLTSKHIIESADRSLQNMGVDVLDVLLLHRPSPMMDPDAAASAFTILKQQGKIKHAGVSNFTPSQFALLQSRLDFPLVTNQIEIHLLRLDPFLDGSLDQCQEYRIAPMAWSPTGGGRIFTGTGVREVRVRNKLENLAAKYGASMDQILYAWLHRHPSNIVTVLGTNNVERIRSAAGSFAVELELQDWFELWSASTGAEVP